MRNIMNNKSMTALEEETEEKAERRKNRRGEELALSWHLATA
jgi:hypothetical protein